MMQNMYERYFRAAKKSREFVGGVSDVQKNGVM